MCFCHTLVIASEKRQEILRQIIFIKIVERADYPKIQCDVTTERGGVGGYQNISRVHIRMKETIAKNLREENRHAIARQFL